VENVKSNLLARVTVMTLVRRACISRYTGELHSKVRRHDAVKRVLPLTLTKDPYYRALEAADGAERQRHLDVSEMEHLLSDLLAKQMVLALQRAEAPGMQDQIQRAKQEIAAAQRDNRTRRSVDALGSLLAIKLGAVFGGLALLFFMGLVLLSVWGRPVPNDARYLVVIVLALSGALSAGFLGGNASARGTIPFPTLNEHPLAVAFTGGIAVLIALLMLGSRLFL
jgi:hypothetical protein